MDKIIANFKNHMKQSDTIRSKCRVFWKLQQTTLLMVSCNALLLVWWDCDSVWIYRSVKTVIAIITRIESAEWQCYRNRQIFTDDETVSLKVT